MRTDHVLFRGRENAEGKRLNHKQRRLLRMSMAILRKSAGVNRLKDLLNEPLMPQEFHVLASFFVKSFFLEPRWLYSCLKPQKTIHDYFKNNNCYNGAFVHIIRTIILNCHVTKG